MNCLVIDLLSILNLMNISEESGDFLGGKATTEKKAE